MWAIGDCTGVALFTHVGKYQARIAAKNVAGHGASADYRAIPAVAFTDPQVAMVGDTEREGTVSGRWEMTRTARASTYERPRRPGFVKVVADPERRVLVGAVAVGPESGEWCQQLTLAIRAEVPLDVLRDVIQPYPTFSEAVFLALAELPALMAVERIVVASDMSETASRARCLGGRDGAAVRRAADDRQGVRSRAGAARRSRPRWRSTPSGCAARGRAPASPAPTIPASAIIAAAEAENADVLVVGNIGMAGRKEFLLGNVPNRVSHNARCTVVIVNTAEEPKKKRLWSRS